MACTPGPTAKPGTPIEVDRLVNATGLIGLAVRQHPVGYHFAGQRVTVRLDGSVLELIADGILLRTAAQPDHLRRACTHPRRPTRQTGTPASTRPLRLDRRVN